MFFKITTTYNRYQNISIYIHSNNLDTQKKSVNNSGVSKKKSNVGITIINHPPVITIDRWYGYHSQSWLVYDIVKQIHIVIHIYKSLYIYIGKSY